YVFFGWLLFFFSRLTSHIFSRSLGIQDYFIIQQFRIYYYSALYYQQRGQLAWAILYLRKSQDCFEVIGERYAIQRAERIKNKIAQKFQEFSEPITEYFSREIGFSSEEMKVLKDFIQYLVDRTRLSRGGVEKNILIDLELSLSESQKSYYHLNFTGWLFSLGRKPLLMILEHQGEFRKLKFFRKVYAKTISLKLPKEKLMEYKNLFHEAISKVEKRIRSILNPKIETAFQQNFPKPKSWIEKISYRKIIGELEDVILEKGHSHFMDLRDIISRNQLKLEDLQTMEVLCGDALARTDRALSQVLPGIHNQGEIYLRFLQIISSIFFGTPTGRWLSKYIFIPFGGSFILLLLLEIFSHHIYPIHLLTKEGLLGGALFVGLAVHAGWFRKFLFLLLLPLQMAWRFFRWLVQKSPAWFRDFFLFPLISSLVFIALIHFTLKEQLIRYCPSFLKVKDFLFYLYLIFFLLSFGLINTPMGMKFRNLVYEGYNLLAHSLGKRVLLQSLFGIIRLFRKLLLAMEHTIYLVIEYLRFIQGERRDIRISKALALMIWLPLSYILTLYILLFIEPQINPLKFPIVSITFKIFAVNPDLYVKLIHLFDSTLVLILPKKIAYGLAYMTAFFFTGIFGFLAWELQENWKLYKRNNPHKIQPVIIGSHGETMIQLLRKGFHSGTLPKLYRKIRYLQSQFLSKLDYSPILQVEEEIHHIQQSVKTFGEREFLLPLEFIELFQKGNHKISQVEISSHHIWLDFTFEVKGQVFRIHISFQEKKGYLFGSFRWEGIDPSMIPDDLKKILSILLVVFFQKGGVEILENDIQR
ncbi:MAG: hypothetical protein D6785_04145, partial [Planctomycetota bacterium]